MRAFRRKPWQALCSDSTTVLGTRAPGARGACWNGAGVVSAWSASTCPFPMPPRAGGPYTETTFPWTLFLLRGPQAALPLVLTCLGGSRTDGHTMHSPQASLCPCFGALDTERGLSCLFAASGGAGACLPCSGSQMPGEPRPFPSPGAQTLESTWTPVPAPHPLTLSASVDPVYSLQSLSRGHSLLGTSITNFAPRQQCLLLRI